MRSFKTKRRRTYCFQLLLAVESLKESVGKKKGRVKKREERLPGWLPFGQEGEQKG